MVKNVFSKSFLIVMACFLMCVCCKPAGDKVKSVGGDDGRKVIKWKMSTTWTPGLANLMEIDKHFAETVNELSAGQLKIKFFEGGAIVPPYQLLDAVASGTLDAGGDWPGYWAGKNTAFAILGSYPFSLSATDYLVWIYQGGGLELIHEVYGKFGVVAFPHGVSPPESGIRSNKPINSLNDFKGLKIRMSGKPQGMLLKDLQASHSVLSGSELYQALEKGVIDATEWATPAGDWDMGLQEVTRYWLIPAGWHQPASTYNVMINKKSWEELPDHLKRIIKIAAEATWGWGFALREYNDLKAAQKFIKHGTKITRLSNKDLEKLQELTNKNTMILCRENPLFAKVAYSQYKFLKDVAPWRKMSQPFTYGYNPRLPDLDAIKACIK
jgi:TRAP-type mannitol/chloroaromatic compound transport system substrate-binding protein